MTMAKVSFTFKTALFNKERTISVSVRPIPWNERRKTHGRAFVFCALRPEDTTGQRSPPYGIKGENAENDRAWKLYNKEEVHINKTILEAAFAEIAANHPELGLPRLEKATHSRYAGCTCPCSPGFIIHGVYREVYIEVADDKVEAAAEPVSVSVPYPSFAQV